jgi:hypothetical protein
MPIETIEDLQRRAAKAEAERDAALGTIRAIGEEFVIGGFPGGDRTVTLANVRQALARLRAAETDAARLEFFATACLRDGSIRFDDGRFEAVKAWSIASHDSDLRAAIDAMRAAKETKQ